MGDLNSFIFFQQQIFDVCGFKFTDLKQDDESSEYHACSFKINNKAIRYRQAKITPTKTGQFVTFWKRTGKNPIQPYDSSDDVNLFVVTVQAKNHFGQFVFPKNALIKHGVLSVNGKGGKRALRVYPPWDKIESKQAQKTQNWQLDFFAEIPENQPINILKFKALYSA
jgi:hypothetical protein